MKVKHTVIFIIWHYCDLDTPLDGALLELHPAGLLELDPTLFHVAFSPDSRWTYRVVDGTQALFWTPGCWTDGCSAISFSYISRAQLKKILR